MDCDSCGRHRPSPEIAPLRDADGRLVMACGRCRRVATDRRGLVASAPTPGPTATIAAGSVVPAPLR